MSQLLFVYGNLKKNFCQNHLLHRATYLGIATTEQKFRLHQVSYFPVMAVAKTNPQNVWGELYELDDKLGKLIDNVLNLGQKFFSLEQIRLEKIQISTLPKFSETWAELDQQIAWSHVFCRSTTGFTSRGNFWAAEFCRN